MNGAWENLRHQYGTEGGCHHSPASPLGVIGPLVPVTMWLRRRRGLRSGPPLPGLAQIARAGGKQAGELKSKSFRIWRFRRDSNPRVAPLAGSKDGGWVYTERDAAVQNGNFGFRVSLERTFGIAKTSGYKGCSSVEFEGEGDPILERVKLAEEIIT